MLPHNWILKLSFFILITAGLVSLFTSHEVYQYQVWPYILIFLGLSFLRHMFFVLGSFLDEYQRHSLRISMKNVLDENYPSISIILPCYNEDVVIEKSLEHLATLNYPNFEVIVVDDGSTDDTLSRAEQAADRFPQLNALVVTKSNGGKANALNYGIAHSSGELIVCVDADSRLEKNSLMAGVLHFQHADTGAVAGFVEIENQNTMLQKLQQLEYMISLNYLRKAYSVLGIVPIVPGPVGMFRREALESVGGFATNGKMFAEDAEMSLRLIANGWRIRSEEGMLAYTEAPADFKSFFRQRYRWNRGTFQALEANFHQMISGQKSKRANLLAIHLFVEIWVVPILNTIFVFNFLSRLFLYQEVHLFTMWIAFGVFIDIWILIMATYKSRKFFWGFAVLTVSKLFYENILYFWKLFCLYDELKNTHMSWDKLDRNGDLKEVKYV